MKTFLLFFSTVFCSTIQISAFGQKEEKSLDVIPLEYEMLDSNQVKAIGILKNLNDPCNFFTYPSPSDPSKSRIAYFTTDKNKWTSALLSVSYLKSVTFYQINLDKKEQEEIVVKGEIVSGCSQGTYNEDVLMIINIDNSPKQIFGVYYACSSLYFGELKSGEERNSRCEREIKISEDGIIVSPFLKNKKPFGSCVMAQLPDGSYSMKDGKIKIKE